MWTLDDSGQPYCARHDRSFTALEPCAGCLADPGPIIQGDDDEAPEPAPEGCDTTLDHERKFGELADLAKEMADGEEPGTAAKLLAESIKARRAASQLAARREDDAFVKRLERRRAAMLTSRGRH